MAKTQFTYRSLDDLWRDVPAVDSHDMLERALTILRQSESKSIPVLHDGLLVGILTPENVAEFMAIESALLTRARGVTQDSHAG